MNDDELQPLDPVNVPPQKTKKNRYTVIIIVSIVIALGLIAGAFFFGKSLTSQTSSPDNTEVVENWQKLVSTKKGFPISNTYGADGPGTLKYYSLEKKEVIDLDQVKLGYGFGGGGASGLGDSSPTASPDLFYTAYIGDDNNLWLLSHESGQTKKLTDSGFVSYITDWSPDGKNILYYANRDTLETYNNIPDTRAPDKVTFKPQSHIGFYQLNIETGVETALPAIEYAEGYIDNERILVKQNDQSTKLVIFDVKTLTADQVSVQPEATFGVGQFDFSKDGALWTYDAPVNPQNPTGGVVNLVTGTFPASATTVIDSGSWAAIQWPKFSPDATKISYQKSSGLVEGIPQNKVVVYDIAAKTKKEYGAGAPRLWIDETTVLAQRNMAPNGVPGALYLIDLTTGQETEVYNYE